MKLQVDLIIFIAQISYISGIQNIDETVKRYKELTTKNLLQSMVVLMTLNSLRYP